jgi:hypothetical protein
MSDQARLLLTPPHPHPPTPAAGVVELRRSVAPVSLVSYYRYFRFLRDGTFLYRTTAQPLKAVHRSRRSAQQQARAK